MSGNRKYAGLPDLDLAPDIYETPELTDDASTRQTTAGPRTESRASTISNASAEEEANSISGVNRHRLDPSNARSQFLSTRVSARDANFSDRIDQLRTSYTISSRRHRRDHHGHHRARRRAKQNSLSQDKVAGQTDEDGNEADHGSGSSDPDSASDTSTSSTSSSAPALTPAKFAQRLARLQRSATSLASDLAHAKATNTWPTSSTQNTDAENDDESKLAALNTLIKSLHTSAYGPSTPTERMQTSIASAPSRPELQLYSTATNSDSAVSPNAKSLPPKLSEQDIAAAEGKYKVLSSPQALALHTSLSSRLDALETLTGLNSLPHPLLPTNLGTSVSDSKNSSGSATADPPLPLLPRTNTLQRQVNLLMMSDSGTMSGLEKRVSDLTTQAEKMAEKRLEARKRWEELRDKISLGEEAEREAGKGGRDARGIRRSFGGLAGLEDLRSPTTSTLLPTQGGAAGDDTFPATTAAGHGLDLTHPFSHPDLHSKLSALHASLPAISQMSPLLPPTLERLKALRGVHQDAGKTSERVAEVERKEGEMREEVGYWVGRVKEVEEALRMAEGMWGGNVGTVEGWVKDLEGRVGGVEKR